MQPTPRLPHHHATSQLRVISGISGAHYIPRFPRPALRRIDDQIADRIFHVVIGIDIVGMEPGERHLDLTVGLSGGGRGAQIVAERAGDSADLPGLPGEHAGASVAASQEP